MNKPKIALQLYTVRTLAEHNFSGVVQQVAKMGYEGVEVAGFPGVTPKEAAELFSSLGLESPSIHSAMPIGEDANKVLDTAGILKCQYIVSGAGPDDVSTLAKIQAFCEKVNKANEIARKNGFILGLHNHWWEYAKLDGRYIYTYLKEWISSDVIFQIDTYWVKTAGVDPAKVVKEFGAQSPLLHIKDGPASLENPQLPMVAVGQGVVNFPEIIKAGEPYTKWLIVEMDHCATDIMTAVRESFAYLKNITK